MIYTKRESIAMWRIRILTVFSLAFLLFSCGTISEEIKAVYQVNITVQEHHPYCGGARPTPEQQKGYLTPVSNQEYFIFNDTPESSKRLSILTDETGSAATQLVAGTYLLFHSDKMLSFEEFYKKRNVSYEQTSSDGEKCYQIWYETPDFKFEVLGDTSLNFTYQQRCFVGSNPCLNYEGPMPP